MLPRVNGLRPRPVGVVLAGGRGQRIGGDTAVVSLAGRPLLSYPVRAMLGALDHVVVVAKPSTVLPPWGDVAVWHEPEQPSHPLVGIAEALRRAALAAAAREAVAPARAVVEALGPLAVPVTDPRALFNVNSAADLREAESLLASG
jgi:molybdopterin-guanine dinucleotide biosynthesis protein A